MARLKKYYDGVSIPQKLPDSYKKIIDDFNEREFDMVFKACSRITN